MFLLGWFQDLLSFVGLRRKKSAKICFLGCDNAGKTTLLRMLRDGYLTTCSPTIYPRAEELTIGRINFRTIDLGGHETARRIWKDYYASVDGIIFIVDAADRTRFQEARLELASLMEDPCLVGVPIVVLGNKIDIPVAASEDELRRGLGIFHHMTSGKEDLQRAPSEARPLEIFMVSIVKKMGYAEAFRWLSCHLD